MEDKIKRIQDYGLRKIKKEQKIDFDNLSKKEYGIFLKKCFKYKTIDQYMHNAREVTRYSQYVF
ncbi:MAG: hypothetical protein UR27_C0006G0012 [Candidatus Peregrinibacteria bacterium GW2011_GWA2_33_10]|nr:MAG: hypothetical protein UR27_C0006G0012 [Candidatus Peregrinibacteria bacterium GW2011_GWA2_33_10]KKP39618.1 MAG: hypothetical protein UR30_C0009G0039 [Candidatus Peregrinibacteria bacterium GW2011_GWC2_33_13]OGJ50078.1 MAG: hypothetical protein A2229_01175 [Candidatus Peregrinibacteria bacterium RIFOXYA2_FULL_33_7]